MLSLPVLGQTKKELQEAIAGLRSVQGSSSNYNEAQELLSKLFLRTSNYTEAIRTLESIPNLVFTRPN